MKLVSSLFILLIISFNLHSAELNWQGRESSDYVFNIPEGTQSFLLSVEWSEDLDLIISNLESSEGKLIVSNISTPSEKRIPSKVYSALKSKTRATYVSKQMVAVNISNSHLDKGITSGLWKIRLAHSNKRSSSIHAKAHINIKILTKEMAKKKKTLRLQLNADTKQTNLNQQHIENVVSRVTELYKSYGITLDIDINYHWKDKYSYEVDYEKKINLLQNGKKEKAQIYLFQRSSPVPKDLQGLAGCLPAVNIVKNNKHCALIIAFDQQEKIPLDKMTKVISHEIAHYLGLFHLSDDYYPYGKILDPLEDTHEIFDEINVMHKKSDFFDLLEFTDGQVKMMSALPLLFQ